MWNIAERRVIAIFHGSNSRVSSLNFSPNNRFLVSDADTSVRIWRMRDGASKELVDTQFSVTRSALSPDGRYVVAANPYGVLRMWDFHSGQLLGRWEPTPGPVRLLYSVEFTSDGKVMLTGGEHATLSLWDVTSLTANHSTSRRDAGGNNNMNEHKEILTFRGHTRGIFSVSIFPGSRWVVSGSWDHSVRIWDTQNNTWQCTLNGHQSGVIATDCSSDGLHLATGGGDSLVRVWRYMQVDL